MRVNKGFRNISKNLDFPLLALTLAIVLFGILMISSAGGESALKYVIVQSVAAVLGFGAIWAFSVFDYEYLAGISKYLCIAVLVLLILVLIPGIGTVQNGARSWFVLGPVSIQPAEFAKIVFIIAFAKVLSENERNIDKLKTVLILLAFFLVPFVLIVVQPDFGTASVFFFVFIAMIFAAGISWKYLVGGGVLIAAIAPLAWFFVLQDYQKERLINVFNPENDPTGAGYHVLQSKLAIGSGRVFGSGLYKGASQVNNMLPERHTDFIYSVVCEELGIIGGILVIILISAIIIRCLYIAVNARNSLGKYMCIGVAAMLIFQTFENIGMCIGIFPVTGITLPFISYGGSSMLTTLISIGIVLNVRYKSRVINF